MKKYKLIKEYPGSPKLGYIAQEDEFTFMKEFTEYWEEVVEKDYEILEVSLARSEKHIIRKIDFNDSESYIESLINCHGNSIHSIKRLSDGEVFTVGDVVNNISEPNIFKGKISEFKLKDSTLRVYYDGKDLLKHIELSKKPLFTTEDGVDIFEGDTNIPLYYVSANGFKIDSCCKKEIKPGSLSNHNLYFSTKEAVEEYVLMNKPCLNINDVKRLLKAHISHAYADRVINAIKREI